MTQVGEAVARYNKILESEPFKDLGWADSIREQAQAKRLTLNNRPVCVVLRPHFVATRQYEAMTKAAEALMSAIQRVKQMALASPVLMARMDMLPAEKMLASIDPGYPHLAVTSLLDANLDNGSFQFADYMAETPPGVAFGESLAELFYESGPVKELRKKYRLTKPGGAKFLLQALLKAYKEFGGKKSPQIGILEYRQPFQSATSDELVLLRDYFRSHGHPTDVVSPDQLEYRDGVLRRGDFEIRLLYRRMKVQEFLVRFDLTHPLVRAYKEGSVCLVNSFRDEIAQKKAIFDLLTDEDITSGFPAAERKVIRERIPWTRVVQETRTTYHSKSIDLLEFISKNREKLVLVPNDTTGEHHSYRGWEIGEAQWDRAMKTALRSPYVVQERLEPVTSIFPVYQHGMLDFKPLCVDVQPHAFLGKVHGCSTWLRSALSSGYTSQVGLAPTFLLDAK